MKDFAFAQPTTSTLARHNRKMYAVTAVVHILLLALIIHIRTQPTRVNSAGSPYGSMTAYVSGAVSGGPAATPKPVEPKKPTMATKAVKAVPQDSAAGSGAIGVAGAGQGSGGPVRLGSGGSLTLVKRVQPVYPPLLQQAQIEGSVMVEAIIDTLGHVEPNSLKVVQTANPGFNESAKQTVLHSLFRPARVYGKAVRVLIHIPIQYSIKH